MRNPRNNFELLVDEYRTLVGESVVPGGWNVDWNVLTIALQTEGGWTPEGATRVAELARTYGSFVLRNALAVAVAAGVEDGEFGL